MANNEDHSEDSNLNGEDSFETVKQRLKDRSKVSSPPLLGFDFGTNRIDRIFILQKVVQTRDLLSKQAVQTREILSKQAVKIAKQAEEHERFINKVSFFFLFSERDV